MPLTSEVPAISQMLCPLCGAELTAANQTKDGRFHCPACFPVSEEARRGWLPTYRSSATATTPAGRTLTRVLDRDPMFAKDVKGNPVTRQRTCECGKPFAQRLLSERFLLIVEHRGAAASQAFSREIPGFYVPVHCPSCERRDLGFSARRAETQRNAEAAD